MKGLTLKSILIGTFTCIYPLVLWAALEWSGTRGAAIVGLVTLALVVLLRGRHTQQQLGFSTRALPLGMLAVLSLSFLSGDERMLKLLPVSTNVLLLGVFAVSLRASQTPTLHEFARLIEGRELTPAERKHCHTWTWVWCAFFALNAMLTSALAVFSSRWNWALHTSLLSYVAMGCIFALEYAARRWMQKQQADQLGKSLR